MADEPPAPATGDPTPTPQPSPPAPTPAPEPQGDPTDLGDAGKKALQDERKARREAEARLKELAPLAAKAKELEEAQKTEGEKLAEKLRSAETDGASAKTAMLRLEVALDKAPAGIEPAKIRKLAERLRGNTREELEADAAELFADFGGTTTGDETPTLAGQPAPKPDPAQGSRGNAPQARPTSMGAAISAALKPKT